MEPKDPNLIKNNVINRSAQWPKPKLERKKKNIYIKQKNKTLRLTLVVSCHLNLINKIIKYKREETRLLESKRQQRNMMVMPL